MARLPLAICQCLRYATHPLSFFGFLARREDRKDVEEHPDDYQWERAKRFKVSQSGINTALKRLRISNKKKL